MLPTPTAEPTDLDYILPTDALLEIALHLRHALPPPLDDTPEALTRRDHAAIAQAASLHPANSFETQLAARAVAASIQSMDALGLAADPAATDETVRKCRAQAAQSGIARGRRSERVNPTLKQ